MTPTEKQKTIAEQAVYGDLKIKYSDEDTLWTIEPTATETDHQDLILPMFHQENSFPVLRPLSDLTKEITHRGYNNDQPFIPLVELAKIAFPNHKGWSMWNNIAVWKGSNGLIAIKFHWSESESYFMCSTKIGGCVKYLPDLFDILHLWHFDTRNLIEKSEAIDANTLDINPYSV